MEIIAALLIPAVAFLIGLYVGGAAIPPPLSTLIDKTYRRAYEKRYRDGRDEATS